MTKYKKISIQEFAFNNFKNTQKEMEKEYERIYKKKKRIPLVKVISLKSITSTFLTNDELRRIAKRDFRVENMR